MTRAQRVVALVTIVVVLVLVQEVYFMEQPKKRGEGKEYHSYLNASPVVNETESHKDIQTESETLIVDIPKIMGPESFAKSNATSLSLHCKPPVPPERILINSFVYGKQAAHKKYLRMFCESARIAASDVDFIIVGDFRPPFPLPVNVKHVRLSWDSLIDRVVAKVLNGTEPSNGLRKSGGYKVNDFKPLFGFLFPEYTASYDWWGHMDNDVVVGNIRKFLTDDILRNSDVLTVYDGQPDTGYLYTWGPFTLYRNMPLVNELFRLSGMPLDTILGHPYPKCFDEWGECGGFLNASMSGIIFEHATRLGLRVRGSAINALNDRYCEVEEEYKHTEHCAHCYLQNGTLFDAKPYWTPDVPAETGLCHYQFAKKALEDSLNETIMARFAKLGRFQVSYDKGFEMYRG